MAGRFWREAATLILTGKKLNYQTTSKDSKLLRFSSDYNVLLMKRSAKSSFFPKNFVFPGGAVDESDFNSRWLNIFNHHGYSKNSIMRSLSKNDIEIYENKMPDGCLPPEMAFRICAVRETFEETGILLTASDSMFSTSTAFPLEDSEVNLWRKRVQKNAAEFMDLMVHIGKIPPILSLVDWSNWLTPTHLSQTNKRFDTIFYLTCLDSEIPSPTDDGCEVEELRISDSLSFLQNYYDGNITLAPPQIYELSRLLNFNSLEQLREFTKTCTPENFSRWLPVTLYASDGALSLLPGDDLYPVDPDVFGLRSSLCSNSSVNELDHKSSRQNRFVFSSPTEALLYAKNISCEKSHSAVPVSSLEIIK